MSETPKLDLPYIAMSQASKEVTHNQALDILDMVVQASVTDRDRSTPPASPVPGDTYIVAAAPTDAWTGHATHLAAWISSQWTFSTPLEGWLAYVQDENQYVFFDGTAWQVLTTGGGGGSEHVTATYTWTTGTGGTPADGRIGVNNATYTVATQLHIAQLSAGGSDTSQVLAALQANDEIYIQAQANAALNVRYTLTATGTDNGAWWTLPVTWLIGAGTFPNNETLTVMFLRQAGTAATFLTLGDTPDSYVGQGGKIVSVKADATGLEFGVGGSFLGLTDTPDTYAGQAGTFVKVNAGASALEFGGGTSGTLLNLTDTPDTYTGQQGRLVSVKSDATGVEFIPQTGGALNIHRGALLSKTAAQTLPHDTATLLTWGTAVYDTNSLWSASQPTRVVVPAGVNRLLLLGQVECDGATSGYRRLRILKNGATVPGQGTTQQPVEASLLPSPAVVLSVQTPPLDVTGGDYFELEVLQTSGAALQALPSMQTWLSVALITQATEQAASSAYDVGVTWNGTLPASQVLIRYPFPRAVTFPAGLPGSRGTATVAATALTTLTLARNGTGVGSVQFAAGATSATFTLASETTFALGDVLTLNAPASPDSTLANLGVALAGTRAVMSGEMGATTFLGLLDTPDTYSGQAGNLVRVNPGATALAFTDAVASDTQVGLVELATAAETTTGTDATRAVTPAGLAAKVPDGTALSVVRYSAAGTAVEATPGVTTTSDGRLGVNATPGGADMLTVAALGSAVNLTMSRAAESTGAFVVNLAKTRGTDATPGRVLANDQLGSLHWSGYARNSGDTADASLVLAVLRSYVEAVDAQGRASAQLRLFTSEVSGAATERLRLTAAGNLLLGATTHGTGLTKGLVVGAGTDPTAAHPADAIQAWVKDRGGVAGKGSLHVRTEDGTSHVLGDVAGHGTLGDATLGSGASYQALNVKGSQLLVGQSSVQERPQALIAPSWVVSTDATRTSRLSFSAYDATAAREGVRLEASGTAAMLGFFGGTAVVKPTVTGSRGGNAALASLLTALANLGLLTDASTA